MQRILDLFISTDALHVSGGPSAHYHEHKDCTYSFRYCQPILLLAAIVDEMERKCASRWSLSKITTNKMQRILDLFISTDALHVSGGSSAHHQEHITVHTALGIVNQFCCWLLLWMSWSGTARSSIG